MKNQRVLSTALPTACLGVLASSLVTSGAGATEPCGDFGECKALVEINASDGDIGFHFLMDGDDLRSARMRDPDKKVLFTYHAAGPLKDQTVTETFVESAEPLCFDPAGDDDPENDDEDYVTLEQFLDRWTPGIYTFRGRSEGGVVSTGASVLGFDLPAAPTNLMFDGGIISWAPGDDLGECADAERLQQLVDDGSLPEHPEDVTVAAWEIVLEPDVEDGDPLGAQKFSIRVTGDLDPLAITVPAEYLASIPDDTPAKLEIGAIGEEDNATFTEGDGICLNEVAGCNDEEDEVEGGDKSEDDGEDDDADDDGDGDV